MVTQQLIKAWISSIKWVLVPELVYTIPPSQPMFVSISAAVETDADATDAAEFCDVGAEAEVAAADEPAAAATEAAEACDGCVAETPLLLVVATVEDAIRLFVSGTDDPLTLTPAAVVAGGATEALLASVVEEGEGDAEEDGDGDGDDSDSDDSDGEDTEDDGDGIEGDPTTTLPLLLLLAKLILLLLWLLLV